MTPRWTPHRIATMLSVAWILAGCSAIQATDSVQDLAETEQGAGSADLQDFKSATRANRARGEIVGLPWVAGKPQPVAREVTLPAALRANVNTTLLYEDGEADLVTFAERVQRATGIPTYVTPDALMPMDAFLPRLAMDNPSLTTPAPATADVIVPALAPTVGSAPQIAGPTIPRGTSRTRGSALPTGNRPLSAILDAVALRLGVYWKYDSDAGAIRIYRTETRVFNVRALALAAESSLELGLEGSGNNSGNAGGQFASQSRSQFSATDAKPLEAVAAKLAQFVTRSGVVVAADGAANTIVVTDTKDALDSIGTFIENENRIMTRRVRLVFEEVTVQRDKVSQAGIDWNVLFNSLGRANAATGTGVGTLLDAARAAGSVSGQVGSGPWAGSSLIISALSELGTVVRHTSIPMLALNRRPATYATRETFTYVKDMQQTQSTSDSSGPTVTVTQDEKTVGTFLTLVPDAQDDGQILLTLAYDDTRLIGALTKEEFGSQEFPSWIQQSRIGGQGVVQQVELRPGQPVVVGGYEQSAGNATRRRLDDKAPLIAGGSDVAQQQQLLTVLIVTAIPEEGF